MNVQDLMETFARLKADREMEEQGAARLQASMTNWPNERVIMFALSHLLESAGLDCAKQIATRDELRRRAKVEDAN